VKRILHVVVGAGIPGYFSNSLSSILRLTNDDVLAIFNFVGSEEIRWSDELLGIAETGRLTYWPQANSGEGKTGSLYGAYNKAIAYAAGKYRLISFIQSDMQMMWWSPLIEEANERLLFGAPPGGASFQCLYSQFPVRGKRKDYYGPWSMKTDQSTTPIPGVVDVAVYSMSDLIASQFEFSGSESDMMVSAGAAGWTAALHPFPFVAAIPYPASVRRGRVVGKVQKPPSQHDLLLKLTGSFPPPQGGAKSTLHPIYMEDWVVPNGWSALLPYWPSDTVSTKWWRARVAILGGKGAISLRIYRPSPRNRLKPASQIFFPGGAVVASAVFRTLVQEFFITLRWRLLLLSGQRVEREDPRRNNQETINPF